MVFILKNNSVLEAAEKIEASLAGDMAAHLSLETACVLVCW